MVVFTGCPKVLFSLVLSQFYVFYPCSACNSLMDKEIPTYNPWRAFWKKVYLPVNCCSYFRLQPLLNFSKILALWIMWTEKWLLPLLLAPSLPTSLPFVNSEEPNKDFCRNLQQYIPSAPSFVLWAKLSSYVTLLTEYVTTSILSWDEESSGR